MPRYKDERPAVRVYTICDESRYLIVRNVPALGCGDDLLKLFAFYGDVEEIKPMDAEECDQFTDVYWIKFRLVSNSRFAKRKLDEFVFLGNKLQVSYAPEFESFSDAQDKLESRRKEVLARLNPGRSKERRITSHNDASDVPLLAATLQAQLMDSDQYWDHGATYCSSQSNPSLTWVSTDQDYFPSQSMNKTVRFVREKLNKIESSTEHLQAGPATKRPRVDNRRRI